MCCRRFLFVAVELLWLAEVVVPLYLDEVTPRRLEVAIGGSANITCTMNGSSGGEDSSSLYFVAYDTGEVVPPTQTAVVNKTTIVYMLRNATEQDRDVICKSGQFAIGQAHVSVGTAPLDVLDFKCRGFDYTYFVCNFTKPPNTILTQYNITYTVHSPNYHQTCELELIGAQVICNLTVTNNYRSNYEFFNFTVTGHNALGTNRQIFWLNHYESVIPPQPGLRLQRTTTHGATLKWSLEQYLHYRTKGLHYEVQVRPDGAAFDWLEPAATHFSVNLSGAECFLNLTELPYAFYWYTVRVRMRVRRTTTTTTTADGSNDANDAWWGEFGEIRLQTRSMRPGRPPRTDVGGFYVGSSEPSVRLYWEQLAPYEENGPNFTYVVTRVERNNSIVALEPLHIDRISATFAWDGASTYAFTICSQNARGRSAEGSRIVVPQSLAGDERHRQLAPKWIRNVYHANNRTYTLSWTAPERRQELLDYTVFWCPSKRANGNECQGSMRFKHLDASNTSLDIAAVEREPTLNFAVSANYAQANMGMQWTMCAVDGSSELVKIEPEFSTPQGGAIMAQWSTDQVCTSLTEGYNITYCEVSAPATAGAPLQPKAAAAWPCAYRNITRTIEKTAKRYTLQDLRPYTTYKLQMYMYSKLRAGQSSDAQFITTLEAAPTQPLNLRLHNVTSRSAWIAWLPPKQMNGRLQYYTVFANKRPFVVNCSVAELADRCGSGAGGDGEQPMIFYHLENLTAFTKHSVYVTAHTVASSFPSNTIEFVTHVGKPSSPYHMTWVDHNESIIQWKRPLLAAGRLEFYEVNVTVWDRNRIADQYISVVMASENCSVHLPGCVNPDYRTTLSVRAVNVAARHTEADVELAAALADADESAIDRHLDGQQYITERDDQDSGGLQCVSNALPIAEQRERLRRYFDAAQYTLYRSSWENGSTIRCAQSVVLGKLWLGILVPALGVVLAAGLLTVVWRKYKRMSKIECVLPTTLMQPAHGHGHGHGHDNDNLRLSDEDAFSREKHRLLASIDGGGGGGGGGGYNAAHTAGHAASDGYLGTPHKGGGDLTPISLSASSGYAGSSHSNQSDGGASPTITTTTTTSTTAATATTLAGGYVPCDSYTVMAAGPKLLAPPPPPPALHKAANPFHDGYVSAAAFPAPDGYISKRNNLFGWWGTTTPSAEMAAAAAEAAAVAGEPQPSPAMANKGPPPAALDSFNAGYATIDAFGQVTPLHAPAAPPAHTLRTDKGDAGDLGHKAGGAASQLEEAAHAIPMFGYVTPRSTPTERRPAILAAHNT